jgi:hypothetical protein
MSRIILALGLATILGFPLLFFATDAAIQSARAQGGGSLTVLDAGVQTSPDGGISALPDLGEPDVSDPMVIVRTVHVVNEREGLWAAVTAAVYLVLKLLQMAKWSWTAFLRKGKMPAILAAVTGLTGVLYEWLTGVVSGYAVGGTVIMVMVAAVTAFYTPPPEPVKT